MKIRILVGSGCLIALCLMLVAASWPARISLARDDIPTIALGFTIQENVGQMPFVSDTPIAGDWVTECTELPLVTMGRGTETQVEIETMSTVVERAPWDWFRSQSKVTRRPNTPSAVEFVSQIGGASFAVAIDGTLAYVGVGPRLVILDVSNPAGPIVVGQTSLLPGIVTGVAVAPGGG